MLLYNEIEIGLIKGRHEMPVSQYLLDNVTDVLDFDNINYNLSEAIGVLEEDAQIDTLVVYVTGLTSVTVELIKICHEKHIDLVLMHYDRNTGNYVAQEV